MPVKSITKVAVIALVVALIGFLVYKYFSPHHACIEYHKSEGIKSGMTEEGAANYAARLCKTKNPFRN